MYIMDGDQQFPVSLKWIDNNFEDNDSYEVYINEFKKIHDGPILIAHSDIKVINQGIQIIKSNYNGVIGAYPNNGFFKKPHWNVVESISPQEYYEEAKLWVESGAQIIGGCCGVSPSHIKALSVLKN